MSTPRLPAGWRKTSINELVGDSGLFSDGDWVESKDQDADGDVRLVQLADVGSGIFLDKSDRSLTSTKAAQLKCTYLEAGDLLISRMGEPLTRACIYPGGPRPAVTAVDVAIVRLPGDPVATQCLMHAINSDEFRRRADMLAGGATRQRISRTKLGAIEINWPSETDRRRIVARIREAMERVEEAERLTTENGLSADALSESALRGAWAEAIVASAPREALGSLGVIVTGSTPKTSDLNFWNGDVPWITPADMDGTRVVERARKHVSSTAVQSRAARTLRSGSVAVVCIGATIGKVALCGVDLCINQQINAITFGPRIDPRFGYWACRALKPEIVRSAKKSTLPILNKSSFAALKIPVPPLDWQRAIAEVLDRAHDIALTIGADARAHREDLSALRASILRQAFSGKL